MNREQALQYLKEQGADVGLLKTGSDAEIIQIAEGIKRLMDKSYCKRCKSPFPSLTNGLCDSCVFDGMVENYQRGVRA